MGDLKKEYEIFFDRLEKQFCKLGLPYVFEPIEKQKSDKLKEIIPLVESLTLVKTEGLPVSYHYFPGTLLNKKIRVDDIPASAVYSWSSAIASLVSCQDIYFEDESKGYAFIEFAEHQIARRFVEEFNGQKIGETGMVYQLSWAPFYVNPSIDASLEKGEEIWPEDPYVSKANEVLRKAQPVPGMCAEMLKFHSKFKKEVATWTSRSLEPQLPVRPGWDDGCTATLCLSMVDPFVEECHMKPIFEKYGNCTTVLPKNEGFGIVEFKNRNCAEQAFSDLRRLLEEKNVCLLHFGHKPIHWVGDFWGAGKTTVVRETGKRSAGGKRKRKSAKKAKRGSKKY